MEGCAVELKVSDWQESVHGVWPICMATWMPTYQLENHTEIIDPNLSASTILVLYLYFPHKSSEYTSNKRPYKDK